MRILKYFIFNFISRFSEFAYWWSDNPHPVFLDESNGFCDGMEIIQTCQWSDVVFCTRSDSKWVSKMLLCYMNNVLNFCVAMGIWLHWGQDFIHYLFCFKINNQVLWIYQSSSNFGRGFVGTPTILCTWSSKSSSNSILII